MIASGWSYQEMRSMVRRLTPAEWMRVCERECVCVCGSFLTFFAKHHNICRNLLLFSPFFASFLQHLTTSCLTSVMRTCVPHFLISSQTWPPPPPGQDRRCRWFLISLSSASPSRGTCVILLLSFWLRYSCMSSLFLFVCVSLTSHKVLFWI
jgi:hypothetical protein